MTFDMTDRGREAYLKITLLQIIPIKTASLLTIDSPQTEFITKI